MCVVVYEANSTFSTVFTHHALSIGQKWRVHLLSIEEANVKLHGEYIPPVCLGLETEYRAADGAMRLQ